MKTLLKFILPIATLAFLTSGCEDLKNAADIKVDTEFTETFVVDITTPNQPDNSATFTESDTIDLNTSDVKDYVDKLKNIEIKKVRLDLLSYTGPNDAEISGSLDVGGGNTIVIPPTNLQALFGLTSIDLTPSAGAFNYIKDELLNQKKLNYFLNGSVSKVPVNMQIRIVYVVTVTANPL